MRSRWWLSGQQAVPGIGVAGFLVIFAAVSTSITPHFGEGAMSYLIGNNRYDDQFWTIASLMLTGVCVAYSVNVRRSFSRYGIAVCGAVLVAAELRHSITLTAKLFGLLLAVFLVSLLWFEVLNDDECVATSGDVTRIPPNSLFELVVVVAGGAVTVGLTLILLSVLLFEASPLLGPTEGPSVAAAYLTGPKVVYSEAQEPFWGAIVGTILLVVLSDAIRHRVTRWLAIITTVVSIAGTSFFLYFTFWTATVAAVGALLTVIVVALVLDERTETKIK